MRNPRIRQHGASPFLGYWPMDFAYGLLMPAARLMALRGLSPHLLSWSCLGLGLASGVSVALGSLWLGGALALAAGSCDALDGMVARLRGVASEAGEVLDAAVDRYSEFFFLAGLCIWYRSHVGAMVLVLTALLGSFMVSYSQAKADAMQVRIPAYWMRRPRAHELPRGGCAPEPARASVPDAGRSGACRHSCECHRGAPVRRDVFPTACNVSCHQRR